MLHIRQHSMPANTIPVSTIVVRQAVEPTVKFHYPQFNESLKVEIEPAYRCSLPLNTRLTKNEIIRAEQIRQASRSVRMFSNFPMPAYEVQPSLMQYPSQVRLSTEIKPKFDQLSQHQSTSLQDLTMPRQQSLTIKE